MFLFISIRDFRFIHVKRLYFFTGSEKLSPDMSEIMLVKSVHVTHFYKLSKFLYNTMDQDFKMMNISFE